MFNVNWATDKASNLSWCRGPSWGISPSHTGCCSHCSRPPWPGSSPHSGPGSGLVWSARWSWWRMLRSLLAAPRSLPRPKLWSFSRSSQIFPGLFKVPRAEKWNVYNILWLQLHSVSESLTLMRGTYDSLRDGRLGSVSIIRDIIYTN